VECALEFGPIVRLNDLDLEGELGEHVVEELDRCLLIAPVIAAENAQPGAVIDGGELVVLLLFAA
jgi:hypothetical protein